MLSSSGIEQLGTWINSCLVGSSNEVISATTTLARLWDAYRNGPAHLFALKQKSGLANVVRWAKNEARPCVDGYRAVEFFEVSVRLKPEPGKPPGHFTMYAAELAKAVLDTLREKRAILAAPDFLPQTHTPGWMAWRKQLFGVQR